MTKPEWYRRSTWTDQDREEFNSRLKRSRDKAQHLLLQAGHLADAGLHVHAIELLDRLLVDVVERIWLARVHEQKAASLVSLGQPAQAIEEYRTALQAEREFPNVRTNAWLDFAWFVLEKQLTNLYGEVSSVLQEFKETSSLTFPIERYRYCGAQAVIADSRGEITSARDYAKQALAEATRAHSGFRYHAKLGLVGSQPTWMEQKLRAIVDS